MKDKNLIIGTDSEGHEIDINTVESWLENIDLHKESLADMVYFRLYNRYLRPFEFDDSDYKKNYKSGFAIIANCCLLIETYVSFTVREFIDTHNKSERCFGYFFVTEPRFKAFAQGGLTPDDYKDITTSFNGKGKGIPKKFYGGVRCGILHNGETRSTWRIRRDPCGEILKISKNSKVIQANVFLSEMKDVLEEYRKKLKTNDSSSELWLVCKERLENIIKKS
jgi:hypothetical protein